MLVVLVEANRPGHLLGRGVYLNCSGRTAHGLEHLARHLADGAAGRQRNPYLPAAAVLDYGLVRTQIKNRDDGSRAVGRWERKRLPPAGALPQGGVLELGFGRGKLNSELSEHLRMGVERVACGAP